MRDASALMTFHSHSHSFKDQNFKTARIYVQQASLLDQMSVKGIHWAWCIIGTWVPEQMVPFLTVTYAHVVEQVDDMSKGTHHLICALISPSFH